MSSSTFWKQETVIKLINLFKQNECLWKSGASDISLSKRRLLWEAITKELKKDDPKLTVIEVKERVLSLKRQYHMLLKRQKETGEYPNSWCFHLLKFLPPPQHTFKPDKWSKEESLKFIELLKPWKCLWLQSHPFYRNNRARNKAYKTIQEELLKINKDISIPKIRKKLDHINRFFRRYEKLKGNARLKQTPPWWYSNALFMKKGEQCEFDDGSDSDPEDYFGDNEQTTLANYKIIGNSENMFSDQITKQNLANNDESYIGNDNLEVQEERLLHAEVEDTLENVPEFDVLNITESNCRICLRSDGKFNLNDCIILKRPSFLKCYERFFQLNCDVKNENIPKRICCSCAYQLMATYELAEKALKSHKFLSSHDFLSSEIWFVDQNNPKDLINESEVSQDIFPEDIEYMDVQSEDDLSLMNDSNEYVQKPFKNTGEDHLFNKEIEENDSYDNENTTNIEISTELKNQNEAYASNPEADVSCTESSIAGDEKFKCKTCGITLSSLTAYKTHQEIHNPSRKRHQCEFCEKSYFTVGSLNVHRRIHTGEMLQCHICPKTFFTQMQLTTHLNIHVGNKTYECEYCGEQFYRNSRYNEHKRRLHGNFKLKCSYCNKVFKNPQVFKDHMYTHKGFPYECDLCGAGRPSEYKCRVHIMQTHKFDADEANAHIKFISDKKLPALKYLKNSKII